MIIKTPIQLLEEDIQNNLLEREKLIKRFVKDLTTSIEAAAIYEKYLEGWRSKE